MQFILMMILVMSSAFAGSIDAYFNHNSRNSYTDPYRNIQRPGDNFEEVILRQIAGAKKSIFIAVQEFRLPLIAAAIIAKKKQGVDVRVVIEDTYNFSVQDQKEETQSDEHEASKLFDLRALVDVNKNGKFEISELESRDAIYMLKSAKIPVLDDRSDGTQGSGLMHHKFVIVDGRKTIVTSANFTLSCIHGDMTNSSTRGNANSLFVVDSQAFAKVFNEEFFQLWGNGRRGNFGQNKTYRGPQVVTVGNTKMTIQFSPTTQRFDWVETVNGLAAKYLVEAKRSIKAALFVFSDQNLADAMEKGRSRGAEIGVLIEPKFAFRPYSELLDLLGLEMAGENCEIEEDNNPWKTPVREAGISKLIRGDVLHHKFAVIDNKVVIVGSQNWSAAANYINDETLVVIEDAKISEQFTQEYVRLRSKAVFGPSEAVKLQIRNQQTICNHQGLYP